MAIRLGDIAPNFKAQTTEGEIDFHNWSEGKWVVLYSHPADFTPVCTTEIGRTAQLSEAFRSRNVKPIVLSVDSVEDHHNWIKDVNETQKTTVDFPIIADKQREVAELYDMIHPNQSDSYTVRSVFIIDDQHKLRASLTYPPSTGRNFDEILRLIDSLQLTDKYSVATPVDWKKGDDVVVSPAIPTAEAISKFPKGINEIKPYLRMTPDPED